MIPHDMAKLAYVIIYVPDVKAALHFYERAFGINQRFFHDTGTYGELDTGVTALAFADETFTPTSKVVEPNRPHNKAPAAEVAFVVEDVKVAYKKALAAGAVATLEPTVKPWGQTVAYVRDLNGFLVELCTAM